MSSDRILITGGAKCGKSAFALHIAESCYTRRAFVATAVETDSEMSLRISRHRLERGDRFQTVEEPFELGRAIIEVSKSVEVAVVDCLTVWLGNLYHRFEGSENRIMEEVNRFLSRMEESCCDLIFVSNEVGWGIVPGNALARSFRDVAGYLNRSMAQRSSHVYLVCAGIPLALKGDLSHLH